MTNYGLKQRSCHLERSEE